MAQLKGKGAMTGVNLVAKSYTNQATKDGKSRYFDVQVDARDSRGPEQTNLHLVSEKVKDASGQERFNNGAPYSTAQVEAIVTAAGTNTQPLLDADGKQVGDVYSFKGNVMPASRGTGLVVNTKSIEAADFPLEPGTLDKQFESMKAAKTARQEQTAQAEAPEASAEVAAEAEVEPQVG